MKYLIIVLLIGIAACATNDQMGNNMPMGEMQDDIPGMNHNMPMNNMMNNDMPMGEMISNIESEEEFIVEMIPHHQEAVDTSRVVLSTENEELRVLAQQIISAQVSEISMMNEWVDNWYGGGYEANYQNMMPDLKALEGNEREIAYIEGMIMHHMMAVIMAKEVLALEPREEVVQFAQNVIEAQSREIAQMREMLNQY